MKPQYKSYLIGFLTLAAAFATLYAGQSRLFGWPLIAGISAATFLILDKLLGRAILEGSFDKKSKAARDLIETLSVFVIVLSGLIAGLATGTVPVGLAAAVFILLGTAIVFQLQVSSRFRKSYEFNLGEDYWILAVAATSILTYFNTYFLFYGYGVLALLVFYDLVDMVRRLEVRY